MGLLCLGSYYKILYLCSPKKSTHEVLGNAILNLIGDNNVSITTDKMCHIADCTQEAPQESIDNINNTNKELLIIEFENKVIPLLCSDKYEIIILALTDLLDKDTQISSIAKIGEYTKDDVLSKSEFIFAEILVDFLLFTLNSIDNKSGINFIKSINKKFIDTFDSKKTTIKLYNSSAKKVNNISKTIKNNKFDSVFTEVKNANLNANECKIFRLKIEDNIFSYDDLIKFIKINLGQYVYSRTKIQKFNDDDEQELIGLEASNLIRTNKNGRELGEILNYSFLEGSLGAPKLLSSAELNSQKDCSNIHIHEVGLGQNHFQLVYGVAGVKDSITEAIDNAIKNVLDLKKIKSSSNTLVDTSIFNCAYDSKTTEMLKNIILPSKNSNINIDNAFGLFIGYNIDIDPCLYSPIDFRIELAKKLESDIQSSISYIENQIKINRLGMHSFYIYILPFNDVTTDKISIMEQVLGGVY